MRFLIKSSFGLNSVIANKVFFVQGFLGKLKKRDNMNRNTKNCIYTKKDEAELTVEDDRSKNTITFSE